MSKTGVLGAEVERRSAEIRAWPAWAQPYDQKPEAEQAQQEAPQRPQNAQHNTSAAP